MNKKNLGGKLTEVPGHAILLVSLLVAIVFIIPNLANLSDGGTQSPGCVVIKVQYRDGCPRVGADVFKVDPEPRIFLGTAGKDGKVTSCGVLDPGDYILQAFYPPDVQFGPNTELIVDANGDGSTTITTNSDHPHALRMNLTSRKNYVRGFSENALNDSSTVKNVTFTGNENKTVWITLPKHSVVLDAQLTLSGIDPCPTNPYLDIGNDSDVEWFYVGEFNQSQVIGNLSAAFNDYLSSATSDEKGLVDIPVVLHSDSAGKMQISDISITYDLNTSYLYEIRFIGLTIGYDLKHTMYPNYRDKVFFTF